MSPELTFLAFIALLGGPTALWLGYRVLRGPQSRLPGSYMHASEPVRGWQAAPEAPVPPDYWICGMCHSLNRRAVRRCYSCKTEGAANDLPAPATVPAALPATHDWVPVMDADLARAEDEAVWAAVAVATAPTGDPEPVPAVSVPEPVSETPQVAPVGARICPFLGLKDDPTTRYGSPDPRNVCHARSASVTSPRRLIPGARRTLAISESDQEALCLTAAHEQCARYPAVNALAGTR